MRLLLFFLTSLSWVNEVLGRAVFAHFMVGNTEHYTASDWVDDIKLAQEAHIDAFALNMAKGEPMNTKAIADAFSNAEALGFKLFFSFDYAGRGPFSKDEVISWINKYAPSSAYFRHQGKPFVSTFEGPDQAEDWVDIKATTGCFFVPDWSSLGAGPAVEKAGGVVDGLFSWAGWPWGDQDMDTYVDASYRRALNGKAYMMPVSPWFYTNLPGYSKNWLWRGDHLWFDRWIQVNTLMPEFVQIISWNDYGESHHIGPIRDHALVAFDTGKAPYRYSLDHHGWRVLLPFAIDRYKNNKATITSEGVSFWYRTTPKDACGTGGTTGNTVSQLQMEFQPNDIIQDSVFFTVLSTDTVSITVSIGGVYSKGVLRDLPDGGAGLYHGSAPFNGRTGDVRITVTRKSVTIADETGPAIKNDCHNGMTGFDAWAGGGLTSRAPSAVDTPSLENEVCVRGTGANDFDVLCRTTCYWGYCPESACVCRATGAQIKLPPETPGEVHPAEGLNSNYIGLCNYACLYGACFSTYCGKDEYPLIEPTVEMPHLDKDCYRFTDSEKWTLTNRYCCKNDPPPLSNCHWVGQGDCADNTCNNKEVTLILDQGGGDGNLCSWWRKKSLCCTPEEAVFGGNGIIARGYPGSSHLRRPTRGPAASDDVFEQAPGCGIVDIIVKDQHSFTDAQLAARVDTEHNPDLQFMRDFLLTLGTGRLPDDLNSTTVAGHIDPQTIDYWWHHKFPLGTFPTQGKSRCIASINDFLMDFFGSQGNRKPLLLCERQLNQMKGRIFDRRVRPVADAQMTQLRLQALSGNTTAEEVLFNNIARVSNSVRLQPWYSAGRRG
ncbi:Glucan endo-1,3-alpha-glucosidase agn1 [Colletotrichum sp. SAR 10_99]|nr:Glucan endo-1,3-alpha-glucosidase agn1 [Colletotrichum sp. SAR 10_98]KAJ5016169.1 Glucan endo-1,3-alpha-glucosidase agn1 [Colletotrichum sp. SAR 10_99]